MDIFEEQGSPAQGEQTFMWGRKENGKTLRCKEAYPKVSVIVPTRNCSQLISFTLESILSQRYPNFEVILIDAGSEDRTLEIVKSFKDSRIFIYSVSTYQRYEMLNKGISQSEGLYLNFLFPGDYYIANTALQVMMDLALDHDMPSMVYCGTLLRPGKEDPKILYRHLSLRLLRKGMQPTSLQSCWFHRSTFAQIGKFNSDLTTRGGFDLFCRFCLQKKLHSVSTTRVLTDFDLRSITRGQVVVHFWETYRVIRHYFGWFFTVKWLFVQRDLKRFLSLWMSSLKIAFLGSKR